MVEFQNGTLEKEAYVEIDGVKRKVHMPKYTGNTPLSAENLNKLQKDLQIQIKSLASGSPLVANSIDEMTDTTRVYVNVSDGYWYYYDGNYWKDGGVYQASEIDSSNLELDGRNVKTSYLPKTYGFDYFDNNMNLEVGNITLTENAIEFNGSMIRVRTPKNSPITGSEKISIFNFSPSLEMSFWLFEERQSDGYISYTSTWINQFKFDYTLKNGCNYYLLFKNNDNSNLEISRVTKYFKTGSGTALNDCVMLMPPNGKDKEFLPTIDTVNSTITFYNDTLVFVKDNWYKISQHNILEYGSFTSSAIKIVFDIDNLTFKLEQFDAKPSYNFVLVGTIRKRTNGVTISLLCEYVKNGIRSDVYESLEDIQKEIFNKTNNNIKSIAHQGYSTTSQSFGNSRISSYIGAKNKGFSYGETDIKFTLDNMPVCCHDLTFTNLDTNEVITISEYSLEELKNYNYYGETIASLDEVVKTCKEIGLGLYIDHLGYATTDTQWNNIFSIIKKYAMEDTVVWLVNNEKQANKILEWYKKAKLSIVTSESDLTNIISLATSLKNDFNEVSIDLNYENISVDSLIDINILLNPGIKIEVWTVDDLETCKTYMPYVSGITSNKYSIKDMM